MSIDYELDRLKSEEQSLFQAKQAAWARWHDAQERADSAYNLSQEAWNTRVSAKEVMSYEYNQMVQSSDNYRDVWAEYSRIRDYNNSRIESLKSEADYEHRQMQECFEQASWAYESGDKASAPYYSQQGHDHKDRRNELNAEISTLASEVKEARRDAEWRAPKTDSSAFHNAKAEFDRAKTEHQSREAEFKRLKVERDRLKAEFDDLNSRHKQAKEAFQKRLYSVKIRNQSDRQRTLDKAGIRWSEQKDAKIVKKANGTTQIYHGGLGLGDGLGHGHTALDQFDNKTYKRDAFAEHGSQNFIEEKTRWEGPHRGIILGEDRDYEVTFSIGMGKKSGQTVIADGHLTDKEFHPRANHNHYGPDIKYSGGKERIEDKGGDRGKYSGPGH